MRIFKVYINEKIIIIKNITVINENKNVTKPNYALIVTKEL